jgi:hypothetical protein
MPRRGFYPGGSTQPNRSFDHDLECGDLHAFGNLVCNGEQRIGGKSIADTVEAVHVEVKDVASHGEMLVPVTNSAPVATTLADHPSRGGLVMVDTSADGKMYFSRHDGLHIAMIDAQDKHAGAVAAHDAIDTVTAADPADNAADVTAALAAVDALPTGNAKFEEGVAAVKAVIATDLTNSQTQADSEVSTLAGEKVTAEGNANGHGPFEWVAVN